ncbi:unnamed protein product, partial [Vitis vinifera]
MVTHVLHQSLLQLLRFLNHILLNISKSRSALILQTSFFELFV